MLTATAEQLKAAGVRATDTPSLVIDDFRRGLVDWWTAGVENKSQNFKYWTRKITDSKWRGPEGSQLKVQLKSPSDNTLVVVLEENAWASRGRNALTFIATATLTGSNQWQTVRLSPKDFKTPDDGKTLQSWAEVDVLGLMPSRDFQVAGKSKQFGAEWQGPAPQLNQVRWVKADAASQPQTTDSAELKSRTFSLTFGHDGRARSLKSLPDGQPRNRPANPPGPAGLPLPCCGVCWSCPTQPQVTP